MPNSGSFSDQQNKNNSAMNPGGAGNTNNSMNPMESSNAAERLRNMAQQHQ